MTELKIMTKPENLYGPKVSLTSFLLFEEAKRRGLEVIKVKNKLNRFMIKGASKQYLVSGGNAPRLLNSELARRCVDQKEIASRLLRSKGFPAPENAVFSTRSPKRVWNWAEAIVPIVMKPTNGKKGRNVYVGIETYEEFKQCFNIIAKKYKEVLIEKFVRGNEYRFTFINGEIVAIAKRVPANVIGDGILSIEQLVEKKNEERKRRANPIHKLLSIDEEAKRVLKQNGFSATSIPPKGELIYLRKNSNVSTGGDAIDVTNEISQEIKTKIASAVSSIPGLIVCGVDVIISKSGKYINIIEINSGPMLSMHHYPWEGNTYNVIGKLLDTIFPN